MGLLLGLDLNKYKIILMNQNKNDGYCLLTLEKHLVLNRN